jgi:hypothetical protein
MQMREWAKSVLILALFSLFSPLSMFAVNAPRGASPVKLLLIGISALLVTLVIVAGLVGRLGLSRSTGIGAALLLVFFSWRLIASLGNELSAPRWVAEWAIPLTLLFLLSWAAWRFGHTQGFGIVMVAMGVALVATPLPGLIAWYATDQVAIETRSIEAPGVANLTPDVFIVVLDGYGRADVLEDMYGFANRPFIGQLNERGFAVAEHATANYSMTAASLASALAMDYLVDPDTVPDHPLRLALYDVIRGNNPVTSALVDLGYEYTHIESGWDGSTCGSTVDKCYEAGFLDEASWTLLNRTPLAVPLEKWVGHAFARNGLRALDDLTRVAQERPGGPRFVFAHVLLPHPPLNLDADCQVRPEPLPVGGAVGARFLADTPALEGRKAGYVDQIQCVNTKILRFLDELGDDSVVLMTGDHGPDSGGQLSVPPDEWTNIDIGERFGVLSAYRLPAVCGSVEPDLDLINGMRLLVGCVAGTELESLPRRSLIFPTPDGDPFPTMEVDIVTTKGEG